MVALAKPTLPVGRVTVTPRVVALWGDLATASPVLSREILDRLAAWDWGDVSEADASANDHDARAGDGRVVAAYQVTISGKTERIWAIWYPHGNPDTNGPLTTILLPHED